MAAQLSVVFPDGAVRTVTVTKRLVVGRECTGVPEDERLLVDDPAVSRQHVELRVDGGSGEVFAIDTSTNGTYLNGALLDRGAIALLAVGDLLRIGQLEAELVAAGGAGPARRARTTIRTVTSAPMTHVVGDIVDYSGLAQVNDSTRLADGVDVLFGELRPLVREHGGTLANFAGDALYAVWDLGTGETCEHALAFVRRAAEATVRAAPTLGLDTGAGPLRMGWGVTVGDASMTLLAGSLTTVLGDATNVAFRLSGLAGREGRPSILVEDSVRTRISGAMAFGDPLVLAVKGRDDDVTVYGLEPDGPAPGR